MCAAIDRDIETASVAVARLDGMIKKASDAGKAYNALQLEILSKEVQAMIELASGNFDSAINLAKEASDIELENMSAPSGPPIPMKPAAELYGEMLAAAGRYEDAVSAYKRALNRRYDCSCKRKRGPCTRRSNEIKNYANTRHQS